MPMKSIVFVTRNLCGGGTERVLTQLASDFAARRLRCTIITMDAAKIDYPLDQAVEVLSIGRLSRCRVVDALRRCRTLRALVKRKQPDVVLAMPEEVGICVLPALLGCGIPVYVSERNNPWTMPRQPLLRWMRRLVYPLAKGIICQTEEARMFFPAGGSQEVRCAGKSRGRGQDSALLHGRAGKGDCGSGAAFAGEGFSAVDSQLFPVCGEAS